MAIKNFSHDVIVCIHNGLYDVQLCIESLIKYWQPDITNNIILVDDMSDVETKRYLSSISQKYKFIQLLTLEEQHYYTKAANAGLRESNADLCTLLNSDTIVTPNWAQKIQAVFTLNPFIGIVGPLSNAASTQSIPIVKSSKDQTAINTIPTGVSNEEFNSFIEKAARDVTIPFVPLVHGFCLTISSNVFQKIGYFDEDLFPRGYGEENDFCFRAEDAGFLLAVAINTFIFHAKSKSYTNNDRIQFMQDGMRNFSNRHGSDRIKRSVEFMEKNPYLEKIRQAAIDNWPEFYGVVPADKVTD